MKNRKSIKIISFLLFISLVMLFQFDVINFDNISKSKRCSREEQARQLAWDGLITEKYVNYNNHSTNTLIIDDKHTGTTRITILKIDISGLYDSVKIGDYIKKNEGELEVKVVNKYGESIIVLDFYCED